MNAKYILLSMVGLLMLGSTQSLADSNNNSDEVMADKVRYQRLLRDVKSIDADYSKAMKQALVEMKRDGKASLETKSRLLSLTGRRDRLVNRITLIALRHGWDIPGTDTSEDKASQVPDEKHRVFEPADQMIKEKYARDARRIAAKIALPVVTIESVRQEENAKKGKTKKWLIF
jgi:hypothetical protein